MSTEFRGTPGIYAGPSLNSRNIFTQRGAGQVQTVPVFSFIDGTYSRDTGSTVSTILRAGLLMGKITSSGLYRPSVIGATAASYTSGATSITVSAAVATEVARLIAMAAGNVTLDTIGPPSAAGTVAITSTTCSAASGTTLTVSSLGVNKAQGSIICPSDGSQVPTTVLAGPYPIDVVDTSGVFVNQPINEFLRAADFKASMLINLLTDDNAVTIDTSVQAWLKLQLTTVGLFTFDNVR